MKENRFVSIAEKSQDSNLLTKLLGVRENKTVCCCQKMEVRSKDLALLLTTAEAHLSVSLIPDAISSRSNFTLLSPELSVSTTICTRDLNVIV